MQLVWSDKYNHFDLSLQIIQLSLDILTKNSFKLQREYILAKPARDAAAKAKMEEEASKVTEIPIHDDNEWNIRYCLGLFF